MLLPKITAALFVMCLHISCCSPKLVPPPATSPEVVKPPVLVTRMYFKFCTTSDDKDKGEPIKVSVINIVTKHIIFESNWIHKTLTFRDHSENTWDTANDPKEGGLREPVTLDDLPNLKLLVQKDGGRGWKAYFRVTGTTKDGIQLDLLTKSDEVLFGSRVTRTVKDGKPVGTRDQGQDSYDFMFDDKRRAGKS